MVELLSWLNTNGILYKQLDSEVVEIEDFGKMFLANLDTVSSIFRAKDGQVQFNLMEMPEELIREEIFYVAFKFGVNWYYYDLRKDFAFNILKYVGKRAETKIQAPLVNLGVHTSFELLNGSGSIQELVKKAKYLGHSAVGICDKNTMAATLMLQNECKKAGIKHVFGYSFILKDNSQEEEVGVEMKIYSVNNRGLRNMLRMQKDIMVDSEDKSLRITQLLTKGTGNVLVIGKKESKWIEDNENLIDQLKKSFEKVFFQVDLSEYKAERFDIQILESAKRYFHNKLFEVVEPVLICDSYYLDADDAKNKLILNKIEKGAAHEQSSDQYFKDIDQHWERCSPLFEEGKWDVKKMFLDMCNNAVKIAEMSDAAFETGRMYMPEYSMTPKEIEKYGDRKNMFTQLLEEGFEKLVPKGKEDIYRERLEFEKYILESTNNVDYMLVQYDTVNWARENDILVGAGRGSAGGSLVLYLLGITLIDPIKYDLLFERFLLPERAGLYEAEVTKLVGNIESTKFVEIEFEGKTLSFDIDSKFNIKRGEQTITVYADELEIGDEIIWDNRDLLWEL